MRDEPLFPKLMDCLSAREACRLAGVSRSWCQYSYNSKIWSRELIEEEFGRRFFLPPTGAGGLSEIASRVFRYYVPDLFPNPNALIPSYGYRQLYLAAADVDGTLGCPNRMFLARRYPHVVPGPAIAWEVARAETWMNRHLPSGEESICSWPTIAGVVAAVVMVPFAGLAAFYTAQPPTFLTIVLGQVLSGRKVAVETATDGSVYAIFFIFSSIIFVSLEAIVYKAAKKITDHYAIQRINGPLVNIAGRVAELITLGRLVTQRALQPLTCKVRVMMRRCQVFSQFCQNIHNIM